MNLTVAGVDIISSDISVPWHENDAIINEVNYMPMIGVSELSRSYIPRFLKSFIKGNGRIPIEPVDKIDTALKKQEEMQTQGIEAYCCTSESTYAPDGKEIVMPFNGLKQRIRALLLDQHVDAILYVTE